MNEYEAEYTILIDGATWGREDISFEAENDEEAIKIALIKEHENDTKRRELLLDYIYGPDGKMIDWERIVYESK